MIELIDLVQYPNEMQNLYKFFDKEHVILKSKNYTPETLKIKDAKAFYMWKYDGYIIGCSGIRHRNYWPSDVYRIYDRFYISRLLHSGGLGWNINKNSIRVSIVKCAYDKMLEWSRQANAKTIIITRENLGKINSIQTVCELVNYHDPVKKWKVYSNYIKVCNKECKACWQRIIYRGDVSSLLQFDNLSSEDYMKRYI